MAVETANAGRAGGGKLKFYLSAPSHLSLPSKKGSEYDLTIVKTSAHADADLKRILGKLKAFLKPDAFTLVVVASPGAAESRAASDFAGVPQTDIESDSDGLSAPGSESETAPTSASSTMTTPGLKFSSDDICRRLSDSLWDSANVIQIPGGPPVYLCINNSSNVGSQQAREIVVARFYDTTPPVSPTLRAMLEASGRTVSEKPIEEVGPESASLASASTVLVMDELAQPVLTGISEGHWETLKKLVSSGKPILWVTKGAQTDRVSDPENAMVQGLFRVARREDPGARLTTLDVQSPTSPATHLAIDSVLRMLLAGGAVDTEYAERDGVLLVPRIVPDGSLNKFKTAEMGAGLKPVVKGFHTNEVQVRLQADQKGSLESLKWCKTAVSEVPVEPGKVDIQVTAMGVNFKDVATTIGTVPENEHMIGCECAGYIRRLGPDVTGFKVGDRVVAQTNGTYVNHLQIVIDRVHTIPDSMSFEDVATIPLVSHYTISGIYRKAR